ncbi:MAG: phytoene/squalene synthase family protein [Anderseniella sp.]|jgi:phytoene synthase|nr:phytoene/squalene synthase family protein [Anderseniella sp.]
MNIARAGLEAMAGPFPSDLADQLTALVRAADRDRYLCLLLTPEPKRGEVAALYALNAELAQVRERISDPAAGEVRLGWWEQVVDGIFAGETLNAPVPQGLARAVEAGDLPRHTLMNMIEARRFDLFDDPMPDLNTLEGYLGETASALIQMSALVLSGYDALECAEVSGLAGVASGIAGLLRSLPVHRARGQCYVPAAMLDKQGLEPSHVIAGRTGAAMDLVLLELVAHADRRLVQARREASRVPEAALPAFLHASLTEAYLSRLKKARGAMLTGVVSRPQWLNQITLFKAAKGETF